MTPEVDQQLTSKPSAGILGINCKMDLTKLPNVTGTAFDSQINEHDPRCHPDRDRQVDRRP